MWTSIEHLPTVIFQIIQDLLCFEDYKSLMDCNKAISGNIKYETLRYHLTLHSDPDNPALNQREIKETYLIYEKVKDKAKQIILSMKNVLGVQLLEYAPCFQGIHRLSLSDVTGFNEAFDFNLFNNIHSIYFSYFRNIKSIASGFENVKSLEIENCRNLQSIKNINNSNSLQRLNIKSCPKLSYLSFPVDNIINVSLQICENLNVVPLLANMPNIKEVTIKANQLDLTDQSFLPDYRPLNLSSLKKLDLSYRFPQDFHDFDLFKDISDLSLTNNTDITRSSEVVDVEFTVFSGKHLCLWNFKVAKLLQAMEVTPVRFDNLQSLWLSGCHDLIHFPNLQNLKELNLWYCQHLKSIPTLPKLRYLVLEDCYELEFIASDQPSLSDCYLYSCSKMIALPFANRYFFKFELCNSHGIHNISMLKQVKLLTITNCDSIASVAGLSGDPLSLQPDEREIFLGNLPMVQDASSLHHIGNLTLQSMRIRNGCEGIHHIGHLKIIKCDYLLTTEGLSNIDTVLEISACIRFEALVDVEEIPLILLKDNEEFVDFSSVQMHRTEITRQSYGLKRRDNSKIKLFAFNTRIEEMKKEGKWMKLIKALLK